MLRKYSIHKVDKSITPELIVWGAEWDNMPTCISKKTFVIYQTPVHYIGVQYNNILESDILYQLLN